MNHKEMILPREIENEISHLLPVLSTQWKVVLHKMLDDSSHMLQKWINQAAQKNASFEDNLKVFLLKRKKDIIKDMENNERLHERALKPNL